VKHQKIAMILGLSLATLGLGLDSFASSPTPETAKPVTASSLFEKKETVKKNEPTPCEQLPQKTVQNLWEVSECYYKKGDFEKTADILKEISRRDIANLESYFVSSWLYWRLGVSRGGEDEKRFFADALGELKRALDLHPTHWEIYTERGDFYYLRTNEFDKAYADYMKARSYYKGDYARKVPEATDGKKAAIEARIARTAEKLDRKGEAVEASCRALFYDPDDRGSQERIERLFGSCVRKNVKDPRKTN
jgi:tetratricopeptide (TPR) repeat protein